MLSQDNADNADNDDNGDKDDNDDGDNGDNGDNGDKDKDNADKNNKDKDNAGKSEQDSDEDTAADDELPDDDHDDNNTDDDIEDIQSHNILTKYLAQDLYHFNISTDWKIPDDMPKILLESWTKINPLVYITKLSNIHSMNKISLFKLIENVIYIEEFVKRIPQPDPTEEYPQWMTIWGEVVKLRREYQPLCLLTYKTVLGCDDEFLDFFS